MKINVTKMSELLEFKQGIKDIIAKPKLPKEQKKIVYPRICWPWQASAVGTAYDYLVRYFLLTKYQELNPKASWVWQMVAPKFYSHQEIQEMDNILFDLEITSKKLETLFTIANLDVVYRTGTEKYFKRESKIVNNINDLKQLSQTLEELPFSPKEKLHLNPSFLVGNKSKPNYLFGDIDLVVDDILIEIKTTKDIKFDDKMWYQVILYYYMFKINGYDINKIGIYYSRFNYLFEIDVNEYINDDQFTEIGNLIFQITHDKLEI